MRNQCRTPVLKTATNFDQTIHQKFSEYGMNAREWMRKCAMLLPEIAKRRIWQKKGFSSIFEYAAKLAGMSRHQVEEALWVMKKIEDKPHLTKVVEMKGMGAVRPVLGVATTENEKFWAEKSKKMSRETLRTYVRDFKNQFAEGSQKSTEFRAGPRKFEMELSDETIAELKKMKGEGSWDELMKEFIEYKKNKIGKPEKVKTASRHIPVKIKRYVSARTNGLCAFPGCEKKHEILHHVDRFALKREHDPDKIVPLCLEHERIVHLGLIENEGMEPKFWRVRRNEDRLDIKHMIDREVLLYRSG